MHIARTMQNAMAEANSERLEGRGKGRRAGALRYNRPQSNMIRAAAEGGTADATPDAASVSTANKLAAAAYFPSTKSM